MRDDRSRFDERWGQVQKGQRVVAGLFGFVFAGIGLSVIIFLWASPFGGFGSPPLFFRVFGSFIGLAFVGFGGTMGVAAIKGKMPSVRGRLSKTSGGASSHAGDGAPAGGYECPRCGAPLGRSADVSPSGDVKCGYCRTWFNVHE